MIHRLVEYQQAGLMRQRASEQDPLLFTAGQRRERSPGRPKLLHIVQALFDDQAVLVGVPIEHSHARCTAMATTSSTENSASTHGVLGDHRPTPCGIPRGHASPGFPADERRTADGPERPVPAAQ